MSGNIHVIGTCLLLWAVPAGSMLCETKALERDSAICHALGEMAGEVGPDGVILQSRLTSSEGLVEGRDYRSPNKMPDGSEKTLWGAEQIAWLKRTLLESDATWKLLISPTPMVGPDDAYKIDNHTNHQGFRHEGRAFFDWVKKHRLDKKGFHVICGDRHWQYHSADPSGIEEFSCGALVDSNSRIGRTPGDPKSTDPDAKVQQFHSQAEASGGFLKVTVEENGSVRFEFFDEKGKILYRIVEPPPESLAVLGQDAANLLRDHLLRRIHEQYDARRRAVEKSFASSEALVKRQHQLRERLRTFTRSHTQFHRP